MVIFALRSKLGKRVRLTQVQWEHITTRHRELRRQRTRIKRTLQDPDFVLYSQSDDNYQYYKFFPRTPVTEKHLLVVVKHLNDEGFVLTAFFLRRIRERGKVKVYAK
jgi:hypothetical protein